MFKLSPEAALDGSVTVENKFIVEYMPYADGDYVKVYLYGLSLAARKADPDDTLARLARRLGLDSATVDAAIEYWTERGLMARLGDDVTYYPPSASRIKIKNYDVDKYAEFNRMTQSYIDARQITPNEYNEYYALMEKYELEWQAMAVIVNYCVKLKGGNVSRQYILAVARNLAEDGYRTFDGVTERLEEYGVYYNDICEILSAMGKKRPDHEAIGVYKKWLKEYKFDKSVIAFVAGTIKHGGIASLDAKLTGYKDLGLFTCERITEYETERKALLTLAKNVNRALGVYYENVEPEISLYIKPWLALGFDDKAILALADHCMKNNLKTLSDLDAVVREFFAAAVVTESDIRARIDGETRSDAEIERLMQELGLIGAVKSTYRAYYSVWAYKYALPADVIFLAAEKAKGTASPFAYMNRILVAWHAAGVKTVDDAKAQSSAIAEVAATAGGKDRAAVTERYSAEELDAIFNDD